MSGGVQTLAVADTVVPLVATGGVLIDVDPRPAHGGAPTPPWTPRPLKGAQKGPDLEGPLWDGLARGRSQRGPTGAPRPCPARGAYPGGPEWPLLARGPTGGAPRAPCRAGLPTWARVELVHRAGALPTWAVSLILWCSAHHRGRPTHVGCTPRALVPALHSHTTYPGAPGFSTIAPPPRAPALRPALRPAPCGWGAPALHSRTTLPRPMPFSEIVPLLAALVGGLCVGLTLGWWHGRCVLKAYKDGLAHGRASSCWVRGELARSRSMPTNQP
jgi:hypothetical protein